ncbi:hypothetical protein [Streptomyces inhibens]|uniref:hypothetical protein n=1 Tax=Streptomyces inhibens TaxID=2293571 RepID=UPI001EE75CFF|nr:hypothetical protein [Streptomyces inhibens]UKY48218.1 hypothetical protein KI385_04960 [Streptomyces inhibens]
MLIDTGRRPDEIRQLAWDCTRQDTDGGRLLNCDSIKEQRLGRELPLTEATAKLIGNLVREGPGRSGREYLARLNGPPTTPSQGMSCGAALGLRRSPE